MLPSNAYSGASAQLPTSSILSLLWSYTRPRTIMIATRALFPWFLNAPSPQLQDHNDGATCSSITAGAQYQRRWGGKERLWLERKYRTRTGIGRGVSAGDVLPEVMPVGSWSQDGQVAVDCTRTKSLALPVPMWCSGSGLNCRFHICKAPFPYAWLSWITLQPYLALPACKYKIPKLWQWHAKLRSAPSLCQPVPQFLSAIQGFHILEGHEFVGLTPPKWSTAENPLSWEYF